MKRLKNVCPRVSAPCTNFRLVDCQLVRGKSLERKTLRSLSIGDNQSAISSLPRDILTKDGLSILHGTQDLHRYIPFSRSGAKSPPERYYWDIPDSFGCQPRCTRSSQNFSSRSDTATFIQDRGQVPFEPQIQRTFSMDREATGIRGKRPGVPTFYSAWAFRSNRPGVPTLY